MDNQKKNIAETIHGWIKDARSSIIVWMLGITVTAIGGVILAAYSDHNKISAHDNILTKDYPKYTKKVDSLTIIPLLEAQKITNIEKNVLDVKKQQEKDREEARKEAADIRKRQDDTYNLIIEIAKNSRK